MEKLVNIGKKQRLTRKWFGFLLVVLSFLLFVFMFFTGSVGTIYFLLLFILLQNGILLFLEAKHGVCPVNALRGKKSMTGWFSLGQEDMESTNSLKQIRKIALKDVVLSIIIAFFITGASYFFIH